jgi:YrbI family 3-deoxy-D-manno-octulosonate 8-phosphate phosphatase
MSRLILSDVDGVLTDSKINIGKNGELYKSFNVKDGYAISNWLEQGNGFGIITARESGAVSKRASELGIKEVNQGVEDKRSKVYQVAKKLGYALDDIIYIGDDISDLGAMEIVSKSCCPSDAARQVRRECGYISSVAGGEGAIRDILDHLQNEPKTAIGVILARSKGAPEEYPSDKIAGQSLIQHVYETASQANNLDEIVVVTDHENIVDNTDCLNDNIINPGLKREYMIDEIARISEQFESNFFVNIPICETLVDPVVIDDIITSVSEGYFNIAAAVTSVENTDDENAVMAVTDTAGKALYFSRQRFTTSDKYDNIHLYQGLYCISKELLKKVEGVESNLESLEDIELLRLLENGHGIQTVIADAHSNSAGADKNNS